MRFLLDLRLAAMLAATLVATLAGCRAAPRAAAGTPLRVLVYNIHAGADAAGAPNLERVAALVRETGADVALLQELDVRTRRSGGVDQPAELARRTGFHIAFGKSLDFDGGDYGIGVLSRWPIAAREVIPLVTDPLPTRSGGQREPRVALRVRIDAPGGPLEIVNTHIDAARDETFRLQEAARLVEATRAPAARRLAGGDLNSEPGSRTQDLLRAGGWRDLWPGCGTGDGLSYPARGPVKRIDYLYALDGGVTCERAEVLVTETSDHRPVFFVLRLQ